MTRTPDPAAWRATAHAQPGIATYPAAVGAPPVQPWEPLRIGPATATCPAWPALVDPIPAEPDLEEPSVKDAYRYKPEEEPKEPDTVPVPQSWWGRWVPRLRR